MQSRTPSLVGRIFGLYRPRTLRALAILLAAQRWRMCAYLDVYWHTADFSGLPATSGNRSRDRALRLAAALYTMFAVVLGLGLVALWYWYNFTGGIEFGLAILLGYPLVWAHLLLVPVFFWKLTHPKRWARVIVCLMLERQVRRLRAKHEFTVVAVAGSVGKTSTKIAIAKLLQTSRRVLWQEGNYNDRVTVPLIFFDQPEPSLMNIFGWLKIFAQNARTIRRPYPYNVVVVELGTDRPYDMEHFAYVKPDVAVLTAISPEHMEQFGTMERVATEETAVFDYAKRVLLNADDVAPDFVNGKSYETYSLHIPATYRVKARKEHGLNPQHLHFELPTYQFEVKVPLLGEAGAKIALAAVAVADMLGLASPDVQTGAAAISAFAGRMQILHGVQDATLIDDTYNSSPLAAKAALDVLQSGKAPQRIALLGSMNELGAFSEAAHREVGEYCDPTKLDWVVTVGEEAKKYLAPVAKAHGCNVKAFTSPYKAGTFVKKQLRKGAVVLAKGSQNRVFTEEALKTLLADKADEAKLVRQSPAWMAKKRQQFGA